MRPPKSILDSSFRYRNAASHADTDAFRRRQRARMKLAARKLKLVIKERKVGT